MQKEQNEVAVLQAAAPISGIYLGSNIEYMEGESMETYIERFELFVECNSISEEKKRSVFLTVIGPKVYTLLKSLCVPYKPKDKTYDQLKTLLMDHLDPKPSLITQRYKFNQRAQHQTETVTNYITELKRIAMHCDYGEKLEEQIRDRFISGLCNEKIKQRILNSIEDNRLPLARVIEIAIQMEKTDQDLSVFNTPSQTQSINKLKLMKKNDAGTSKEYENREKFNRQMNQEGEQKGRRERGGYYRRQENDKNTRKCVCCGKIGHEKFWCWFKDRKCNICKRVGHLSYVCNNQSSRQNFLYDRDAPSTHLNESDLQNIFHNNTISSMVSPFAIELKIEDIKVQFEIDTGSGVSVINKALYERLFDTLPLKMSSLKLKTYTSNIIEPVGYIDVKVQYENDNIFKLPLYVIEKGGPPLLGRDWIKKLNILDIHFLRDDSIKDLFCKQYPEVLCDKLGCYTGENVELTMNDNSKPKYCKARPLPFSMKDLVEEEINRLVKEGILSPVKSSKWATPIVPVLKPNGKLRICGDFRITINPHLTDDKHPIPRIEDLFNNLNKGQKFSKIDLAHAYQQLNLSEQSKGLVVINTHLGLFQYNRLPFGVKTAPNVFQRVMDHLFGGKQNKGIGIFMDDLVITGRSDQEHLQNLHYVFQTLRNNGLTVSTSKCIFMAEKIHYLGYVLSANGLKPDEAKVEAITKAPEPQNVTELKSFLGLVNYYIKFLPNMSTVMGPLYDLLKKDATWNFDIKCKQAFHKIKNMLTSSQVLAHYDPSVELYLACDASAYGIGAVLSQKVHNVERPIAFISRSLSKTEKQYSQIDKEALALVFGVTKFNQYLWGRKFTLITDSKPLLTIFGSKKGIPLMAAGRLQRYSWILSGYNYNIIYVKSEKNNADCLSRLPLERVENYQSDEEYTYLNFISDNSYLPIDSTHIQKETVLDPILKSVLEYVCTGWPKSVENDLVKPYFHKREKLTVEKGVIMYGYRVVIPNKLQSYILKELHTTHLGVVKMKSIARCYFWWPSMDKDIEIMANSCSVCLSERPNPNQAILHVWEYPKTPWSRLHLDYLGPFHGKMYLVVQCAYTKWLEVFEVTSTSATQAIGYLKKLFATFGYPELIYSDNGPPFHSVEFTQYLKSCGIKQSFSPPYHPQTNGLAESAVKLIKRCIKRAIFERKNVNDCITEFLFSYRNAQHSTTGETPSSLMFNRKLRTKFDLLKPNLNSYVQNKQESQKFYAGGSRLRNFQIGQKVIVRNYINKDRWIEANVIQQLGPVTYLVKLESGIVWKRHVDQIIAIESFNVPTDKCDLILMKDIPKKDMCTEYAKNSMVSEQNVNETNNERNVKNNVQKENNINSNENEVNQDMLVEKLIESKRTSEGTSVNESNVNRPQELRRSGRVRKVPHKLDL